MPALPLLLHGQMFTGHKFCTAAYFYFYWASVYSERCIALFVCIEVFRSALSAFSGLQRLGTVVFRWAALVAVLVSLSTLSFERLAFALSRISPTG